MAERTTRTQVEGIFERFIEDIGGTVATSSGQTGAYTLDYAAVYGGYVIEQYAESGGVSHPFGSSRRGASEMWYTLHFAREALHHTGHLAIAR